MINNERSRQLVAHVGRGPAAAVRDGCPAAATPCRPRLVSAGAHQGHRRADVRQQHAGLRNRAADHREGPVRVHRPRTYEVKPDRQGVDAVLIGEILAVTVAPAAFNEQQQATRYVVTLVAKIEFRDVKSEQGALAEPAAACSARSTT